MPLLDTVVRRLTPAVQSLLFVATLAGLAAASVISRSTSVAPGFVYPLDDTYIHLALARTLAESGVWGLMPTDPAAASSSPLWTLVLALFYAVTPAAWQGALLYLPLLLNLAFGIVLIRLAARLLPDTTSKPLHLLIFWIGVPLPVIALLGMEHLLHLMLMLGLLRAVLATVDGLPEASLLRIAIWTALFATARYESLLLLAPLGLALLAIRRPAAAVVMALAAAVPLIAFGLCWVDAGGWLVPNSLLLKGTGAVDHPDLLGRLASIPEQFGVRIRSTTGKLLALLMAASVLVLARIPAPRPRRLVVLIASAITATLLQITFGDIGWLYRYEAWLIGLNLLALFAATASLSPDQPRLQLAVAAATVLLAAGLAYRDLKAGSMAIKATDNRRWEHFPVAHLLRDHFRDVPVMVNDIGLVTYIRGARAIDLFGLGHNAPVRLRRQPGGYDDKALKALTASVEARAAVVQVCWSQVYRRVPDDWILVGYRRGPANAVFLSPITVVAFFATVPSEVPHLRAALQTLPVEPGSSFHDEHDPKVQAYAASDSAAARQRNVAALCDLAP